MQLMSGGVVAISTNFTPAVYSINKMCKAVHAIVDAVSPQLFLYVNTQVV